MNIHSSHSFQFPSFYLDPPKYLMSLAKLKICKLGSHFSILQPLNKACAVPVSASVPLLVVQIQLEKKNLPGQDKESQLGPQRASRDSIQFSFVIRHPFHLAPLNCLPASIMPTLFSLDSQKSKLFWFSLPHFVSFNFAYVVSLLSSLTKNPIYPLWGKYLRN